MERELRRLPLVRLAVHGVRQRAQYAQAPRARQGHDQRPWVWLVAGPVFGVADTEASRMPSL
jgi:hypothetical protein